jgi:transposase InsO family protein
MIDRAHPTLSINRQCHLLGVSRATVYRRPRPVSADDLQLMALIDRQYLARPYDGSRRMAAWLATQGHPVNRKRVQRLMRLMGLVAIYPRPNTSKAAPEHPKYPYRLGGLTIDRVNQVWASDITYIPLAKGLVYLVAIMDWHSRAVLAWRLSNTRHADFCVEAVEEALRRFGKPDIFNSERQRATGSSAGASPGQPIHQRRLHRRAEGARHQDQPGRQRPVSGQHLCGAPVEEFEIRGGVLARLHLGRQGQGGDRGVAALLQRGAPSSDARLPNAPADLRHPVPVDRRTIGCADRLRFPHLPSTLGQPAKARLRPQAHRHPPQQGFGD